MTECIGFTFCYVITLFTGKSYIKMSQGLKESYVAYMKQKSLYLTICMCLFLCLCLCVCVCAYLRAVLPATEACQDAESDKA